jgi:hypothetical protein
MRFEPGAKPPHGALSTAAYYGHENIVALLCKHGVDLDE